MGGGRELTNRRKTIVQFFPTPDRNRGPEEVMPANRVDDGSSGAQKRTHVPLLDAVGAKKEEIHTQRT